MKTNHNDKGMKTFRPAALAEAGIHAIRSTLDLIIEVLADDPEAAVRETWIRGTRKKAIEIDLMADLAFAHFLHTYDHGRFKSIQVTGEERFSDEAAHYKDRDGTFVLVDALDGSDLAERGLSNWCSAAVFFEPARKEDRIRAAVVGIPPDNVYFATADDPTVKVCRSFPILKSTSLARLGKKIEAVEGLPPKRALKNSSLHFYGQKVAKFLAVAKQPLWNHVNRKGFQNLRVYNLGGTPMLVHLCDHRVKTARGVDAVIEIKGQKPHDAVPGLFFAVKAGATVLNLEPGKNYKTPIKREDLEKCLFNPSQSDVKYIAASSLKLAREVVRHLKPIR